MKSSTFNSHYSLLGDLLALLTDYHANGAYEKLKENVTLLDKENYAVMIRTTNFESKNFSENFIYVDKHAYEYLKKSKVYPNDLIMNKIANPGTVYFMPNIGKPVSLGMNLFLLRIDKSKADPYFVYSFLRQNEDYVKSFASGSTTKTITKDDVRKLRVYSPPLPEQIKIAEILSTWDNAINTVQKLLANSQQQKKALMQQLLTGKKRFAGFEGEWEEKRLGDISDMNSGGTPKSSVPEFYNGDFPWVSIADMTKQGKFINFTERYITGLGIENSSARLYPKNTILYAMYASIGESSIANVECCSSQAILGIRTRKELYYEFLYFYLCFLKEEIKLQGQQGTQSNLNAGMVKDFKIKLPSLPEQQKIAAVLTTADQEIDNLRAQLNHLKQEKKALMQQLLTGKRRVKVAEAA